ncbi:hypothetical protein BOX15_Mlig031611g1 [Macrostomum lignano]|uniref:Suppressor protein SRP40 n=2 Tax=Macrostomum lignano TaxID=282301 RepID=A0A1I8JDS8_9PLAT|nr:hypothetical protein BOX15_Mlig031611g1 [Macrostomum lignano]
MTSQKLQSCNTDSDSSSNFDSEIAKATVPKTKSSFSTVCGNSIGLESDVIDDDDEIISPHKNRRSMVLSDDEEEHLVRLDLHEQAHEEQLESLINLGVAERRCPVPDRMRTVVREVDGRKLFSVEPAAAVSDDEFQNDAAPEEAAEIEDKDDEQSDASAKTKDKDQRKDDSGSSGDEDKDFIVSDSATPSYHESAGPSSSDDEAEPDSGSKTAGTAAGVEADKAGHASECRCQCQCPSCRRCEFKCRKRWRQKRQQQRATGAAVEDSEDDDAIAEKKRRSRSSGNNSKSRRLSSSSDD